MKTFEHTTPHHPPASKPHFMESGAVTMDFDDAQAQYTELLSVAENIVSREYTPKSDQELRDLGSWALKLTKSRALYPLQAEKALTAAGAVFNNPGYRRLVRGIIKDIHSAMGDSSQAHDIVSETFRTIDTSDGTVSISQAALDAQVRVEEQRGFNSEEALYHLMQKQALKNEKDSGELARQEAITNSKNKQLVDVATGAIEGALYDPFAEDNNYTEDEHLVPVRRKKSR